jgi:hypothetical protein
MSALFTTPKSAALLLLPPTSSRDPSHEIESAGISQAGIEAIVRPSVAAVQHGPPRGDDLVGIREGAVTDHTAASRLSMRTCEEIPQAPQRANQSIGPGLRPAWLWAVTPVTPVSVALIVSADLCRPRPYRSSKSS